MEIEMSYVDPETVNSPKASWLLLRVLINTGHGGWSAAYGKWEGRECLAVRWNGSDAVDGVGNPQSRGHPTWFVIPDELESAIQQKIAMIAKTDHIVTCTINRPNDYQEGAWRIEASLGSKILKNLGGSDLLFTLPEFLERRCMPEKGYFRAEKKGFFGSFVEGKWFGDLYSNGIAEANNPVTVEAFRDAFTQNVIQAAQRNDLLG